jgi:hypothetical protein
LQRLCLTAVAELAEPHRRCCTGVACCAQLR